MMECPKCKSKETTPFVGIPERKSNTVIAQCNSCGHKIKFVEVHGKSIFDDIVEKRPLKNQMDDYRKDNKLWSKPPAVVLDDFLAMIDVKMENVRMKLKLFLRSNIGDYYSQELLDEVNKILDEELGIEDGQF